MKDYKQYNGQPWKDENGWWMDIMIPEVLQDLDALIDGLNKVKEDAKLYYAKQDNEHARKVNAAICGSMVYSKGPGADDLLRTLDKLGYIDHEKLSSESKRQIEYQKSLQEDEEGVKK